MIRNFRLNDFSLFKIPPAQKIPLYGNWLKEAVFANEHADLATKIKSTMITLLVYFITRYASLNYDQRYYLYMFNYLVLA